MSKKHNNQRDRALKQLAEKFEAGSRRGENTFFAEEELEDLLSYYFGLEDFDLALSVADLAISRYKFTPEFYKWKALLHKINAQEEGALRALDQLNIYAPSDVESLMLRLEVLVHFDRREEARDTLNLLVGLISGNEQRSVLVYYDAVLLMLEGDIQEAFNAFCESIQLDSYQEAALAEVTDNPVFSSYRKQFLSFLSRQLNRDAFNDLLWFYRGLVYDELHQDIDAIEAYGYALALNDQRPDYSLEYADKLFDLERFDEALAAYLRYLRLPESEHSYETSMRMGRSYQMLDDYASAKQCYLRAADLEPGMYDIYQHLGECCVAEESWAKAADYYEQAVKCNNHTAECWLGVAYCSATTNENERAEEAFLKAIEMSPTHSDAYVTYALFLVDQGRERDALAVVEEARGKYYDAALA
ncbi:MAG: tetratricopeptide repeat protein, partial [Bacteroidota bacterium]